MEHSAPYKHIFCPYTHLQSQMESKSQNIFPESSHIAYQIKGNGAYGTMHTYTLGPWGGVKVLKSSHVVYQNYRVRA